MPANELSSAMNQLIFSHSDYDAGSGVTLANIKEGGLVEEELKAYGYYYPESLSLGWVKAFNDYRGLETTVIKDGGLDESLKNWYAYQYDESSDSFTKILVPVGSDEPVDTAPGKPEDTASQGDASKGEQAGSEQPSAAAGDVYEAIDRINAERAKAGLNELEIDSDLMEMAAVRAEEMSEVFAHTRPDGSDWKTIFGDFGWSVPNDRGENGGAGRDTAEEQVNSWMNSSGHKENILEEGITKIGVGHYYNADSEYGDYWAMITAG